MQTLHFSRHFDSSTITGTSTLWVAKAIKFVILLTLNLVKALRRSSCLRGLKRFFYHKDGFALATKERQRLPLGEEHEENFGVADSMYENNFTLYRHPYRDVAVLRLYMQRQNFNLSTCTLTRLAIEPQHHKPLSLDPPPPHMAPLGA